MAPLLLLLITLLIIFILTVLIETVALQLLKWGAFKQCVKAATAMNLASIIIWPIMVFMVGEIGLIAIAIAIPFSIVIEGGVLSRMKHEMLGYNFLVAMVANLASYLILLLPAFWYSRSS